MLLPVPQPCAAFGVVPGRQGPGSTCMASSSPDNFMRHYGAAAFKAALQSQLLHHIEEISVFRLGTAPKVLYS